MNTGDAAGSWRDAVTGGSRAQTRSRGSKATEGGMGGANQDLNRGFREEEMYKQQEEEQQQQYDDEGYYDQQDESN